MLRISLLSLCFCISAFAVNDAKLPPTIYFSPEDHVGESLVSMIDKEDKSIKVAVYCFTHREIAASLVRAQKRGVDIEVIVDPFSLKRNAGFFQLVKGKVPVFVWNPTGETKKPLMHDKFCVFGNSIVWTGSFNFTYEAASFNRENAIVLHDETIAARYLQQFADIKKSCITYKDYKILKK